MIIISCSYCFLKPEVKQFKDTTFQAKRNAALMDFVKSKGKLKICEISEKYGVSTSTISRWKREDNWNTVLQISESKGSLSNFLPAKTADIVKRAEKLSCAEILWQMILLQYAAIINAQKIMNVDNLEEILQIEKRSADDGTVYANEWENHTPWERQKAFMDAQSRAIRSLAGLLKQFEELASRSLVTDELKARIELLKKRTETFEKLTDTQITVITQIPEKD